MPRCAIGVKEDTSPLCVTAGFNGGYGEVSPSNRSLESSVSKNYFCGQSVAFTNEGGLAMVYSGELNDLIMRSPVLGGCTRFTIPDPDYLVQLFDPDGNPLSEPSTWINSGYATLESDTG